MDLYDNNLWKLISTGGYPTINGGGINTYQVECKTDFCVKDVLELVCKCVIYEMQRTFERETCWGDVNVNGTTIAKFGETIKLDGSSKYFDLQVKKVEVHNEWNCYTINLET